MIVEQCLLWQLDICIRKLSNVSLGDSKWSPFSYWTRFRGVQPWFFLNYWWGLQDE